MLRFPRRDRFAPQETPTRERRETAFANDEKRPAGMPESSEGTDEYRHPIAEQERMVRNIANETHRSAEATLSAEHGEKVAEDPSTLIARIRALEEECKRYREFVEGVDMLTTEGRPVDPARAQDVGSLIAKYGSPEVRSSWAKTMPAVKENGPSTQFRILTRADAAQGIQALLKMHGAETVQQWLADARPGEIAHMLGIPEREISSPGTLQRAIGIVADWGKRLSFNVFRWNTKNEETDDEKRHRQADYFAATERTIIGLKGALKTKLTEQADRLQARVDADLRKGLAAAAGVSVEELYEQRAALKDKWDTAITEALEQKEGVTLEETIENVNDPVRVCEDIRGLTSGASDFLDRAQSHLARMAEFAPERAPDLWRRAIEEARREHAALEPWIRDYLEAYDQIEQRLAEPTIAALLVSATGAPDAAEAREMLRGIAAMLRSKEPKDLANLKFLKTQTLRLTTSLQEMLHRGLQEKIDCSGTALPAPDLQRQTDVVEQLLAASRIQQSHACRVLGIPGKIAEQIATAHARIPGANASTLRVIGHEMRELEKALRFIETSIPKRPQITKKACRGYCDFGAHTHFVNPDRHRTPPPRGPIDEAEMQRTADHEFGHLVLDTFTERTTALVTLHDEQRAHLRSVANSFGIPSDAVLEEYLEAAAHSWGMDRKAIEQDGDSFHSHGGGRAYYERKRLEELQMQYATYRAKIEDAEGDYDLEQDGEFPQTAKTLFRMLDAQGRKQPPMPVANSPFAQKAADGRTALAYRPSDDDEEEPTDARALARAAREAAETEQQAEQSERKATAGATLEDFKNMRKAIKGIRDFIQTYPEAASTWLGDLYNRRKKDYEEYFRQFNEHIRAYSVHEHMPDGYKPESDEALGSVMRDGFEELKKAQGLIKDFDAKQMLSVSHAQPQGKEFWLWFTRDIQWLSIHDYWIMATEGWEDIKRLWKRRGENARGKVGELLTGWIGDKVPYFGQLKHEFHRRQQSSEQEAVSVWEKALENVDSYKLIEDLLHVNNPDHLKAVMILLTKRGRLDWDNKDLWRSLSRFSHFKIPEHECHRDPVLLDKWLQKVIADIWTDKDLYRTWKTTNEHSYNSERDKFSGVADFFSNAGLLAPQLEYMLKTFVEARDNKEPIPDQVNPHLYEQLFLYAMTRGKMSMEQKFYYFIRGLETNLIPFDRLSIINSQISTKEFPFIDFFYGRNNTLPEILEIAKSITETEPDKKYKAGPNTTAFLMEEVCKDETTRQRVFKVIDRKGDEIDHEDIPLLVAYATYSQLNNFLQPMGGQKQRITTEGIKNGYVGYNTLFKVHGLLARKRAEQGQSLSPSDVDFLVSRLISYIHYDNIVVRQASDLNSRPSISFETLERETMPSGSGKRPKEFRDKMNELVDRIMSTYRIADRIDLNAYLGLGADGKRERKQLTKGKDDATKIHGMTREVYDALSNAVSANPEPFIRILQEMSERLMNEGDDSEQLTFDKHKEIFNRQKRFAKANGNGNGGGGHH